MELHKGLQNLQNLHTLEEPPVPDKPKGYAPIAPYQRCCAFPSGEVSLAHGQSCGELAWFVADSSGISLV